jgi:hypothetical protein
VPYKVRNFDAIVKSKVYGGCAEHSEGQIDGGKSGIVRKKLQDGTRAVLIYAPDVPKMHELIQTLEIWPAP